MFQGIAGLFSSAEPGSVVLSWIFSDKTRSEL